MTLPTIHTNGTSAAALVEQMCAASAALDAAYSALRECAPNGRDYYPQGPGALEKASAEHLDRLRRLDTIKGEVDALTMAIDQLR